ncbi:MAG: cation transporter [Phycisphaeraceae bacterium]|nr:MAG: cation transporter [Phycisphaeraceae bacterium]
MTTTATPWTPLLFLRALVGRTLIFFLLWAALAGREFLNEWPLVVVSVCAATAASFLMWPPQTWAWRPAGLITFAPYFLWQSLMGGTDVARRALSPKLPISPGVFEMDLRLKREPARVFLIWTVSLLPGTAGIGLNEQRMRIHVLNTDAPNESRLRRLEDAVASLFGERLTDDGALKSKRNAE